MSATMATAIDAEFVAALHDLVRKGLEEAARRHDVLLSEDIGDAGGIIVAATWLLERVDALPLAEVLVLGLRLSTRSRGLDRASVAMLLGVPPVEVERLENSTLQHLLRTEDV